MPTNATDTDSFVANVQRPNNGELADSASLAQGFNPLTQRTRWLHNRTSRLVFDVRQFGATVGTGADSRAAIQAAIDAASAANVGEVHVSGLFRIDNALNLPRAVSLIGVGNGAALYLNHASANFINLTSHTDMGNRCVISGLNFEGLIANSGTVISDAGSDRAVLIDNCSFNDDASNLTGRLAYFTGTDTWSGIHRSRINVVGAGEALRSTGASGRFELLDNIIRMPASFADALVTLTGGQLVARGNFFDNTLHTSGTGTCIALAGGSYSNVSHNVFTDWTGGGAIAILQFSGAVVQAHGNDFRGAVTPYYTDAMANKSHADMRGSLTSAVSGATLTMSNFFDNYFFTQSVVSSPAITFPAPIFRGQRLRFAMRNATGTSLGFSIAPSPAVVKETLSAYANGITATAEFVAQDPDGTGLVWYQLGKWSYVS